jgi:hypothetical protein
MNPRFGRRSWVKLWVNEWLEGTTRCEMTDAQRAFFIDLLAMAGRSRFPGIVCAGQINDQFVGYPLTKFQSLMTQPIDVLQTLELFQRNQKVKLSYTQTEPFPLVMVEMLNWERYQSEYQRQKPYRLQAQLQKSDSVSDTESNITETETDTETEKPAPMRAKAARTLARFEEFWKRYPRKSDRKRAFTAWRNLSEANQELAIKNLEGWIQCRQWREDGGRYVPYAQKWLNRELFKDDPRATAVPDDFDERFNRAATKK